MARDTAGRALQHGQACAVTRSARPTTRPRHGRPQATIRPGTGPRHGRDTAGLGVVRTAWACNLGSGFALGAPNPVLDSVHCFSHCLDHCS